MSGAWRRYHRRELWHALLTWDWDAAHAHYRHLRGGI